jgi:rRNA-processing protein EBP2
LFCFSYQHTLSAVKQALTQLDQAKIPYQRPDDYYAEMVKTDAHMAKVEHCYA